MKLYIKYMVCRRCKMKVEEELLKLGLKYLKVDLGVVELMEVIPPEQRLRLGANLLKSGLELIDDSKSVLKERIINVIIEMVHDPAGMRQVNFSEYLSEKLNYNYIYLSNLFMEEKGMTIQHYIILHKIYRVKELLQYDEMSLTEISYQLNYSSVAHLSNQFKKVTGLSPSFFNQNKQRRENLEDI